MFNVMTAIQLIILVVESMMIAMLSCFAIQLITKMEIREWVIAHAPKLISKAFECNFCLCWWTCLLFSGLIALRMMDISILMCAVIGTPIARKFLN